MSRASTPRPVEVVLLDVNETLTDLGPLDDRFAELGAPRQAGATWFASTLRDGFAVAATGGTCSFADAARGAAGEVLAAAGVEDVEGATARVLAAMAELDLLPDVAPGLRTMREAGLRLVALTNGATVVTQGAFERAGVMDLLETRLSVDSAGAWKPVASAYRWAAAHLGVPLDRCALVAVHPWDLHGAAGAGARAVWVDRRGAPWPPVFQRPHMRCRDLVEVAAALDPGLA